MMKELFDIIFHVILERPGDFQIHILEAIKRRATEQLAGQRTITQNAILRALKNKHLIIQDDRLLFAWRFFRLLEDGAAAFQEMEDADFLRTLRYHWTKMEYKPAISKGVFEDLVRKFHLLTREQRKTYLRVIMDGTLPEGDEEHRDLYLGWLAKECIKEGVLGGVEVEGKLEERARAYAEEFYTSLTPELKAGLLERIPQVIENLGLHLAGKEELFREVYETEVDFELWHQRVPQIMRASRTRSELRSGILELLGDKAVLMEVQHEAKSGQGKTGALASFCIGLRHMKKGQLNAAINAFSRCIQLGLNIPEVLVEKAHAHYRNNDYLAAARILQSFDQAHMEPEDRAFVLEIVEDLPPDQFRLGWELVQRYELLDELKVERLREFGESFLEAGDFAVAEGIFQRLLEADPKDFDAYYFMAKSAYLQGDRAGAREWINQMIQLEQRNFYSYYRAALLYVELNSPGEALEYLGQSLELNPDFAEGINLLARLQVQSREAIAALVGARTEREVAGIAAVATFDQALRWASEEGVFFSYDLSDGGPLEMPGGVVEELQQGVKAFLEMLRQTEGDSERVKRLEQFESLLEGYRRSCDLLGTPAERVQDRSLTLQLVQEYMGQRQYGKALRHLHALIKGGEPEGQQFFLRGLCHFHMGRLDAAEGDFAAAINNDYPLAHLFLGRLLAIQNHVSNAAAELHRCREEAEPTPWQQIFIARTFVTIGDFRAAQTIVEPFLQDSYPDREVALYAHLVMGESLYQMGSARRAEAEKHLQRFLKGLGKQSRELIEESLYVFRMTRNLQMLDRVIKVLQPDPGEQGVARNHYHLGRIFMEMATEKRRAAHLKKAIEQFRKAVMLNPMHYQYHFALGNAYLAKGQTSDALASFQIALDINPRHYPSAVQLGKLKLEAGQLADAFVAFERAVRVGPAEPLPHLMLARILSRQSEELGAIRECAAGLAAARRRGDDELTREIVHQLAVFYINSSEAEAFPQRLLTELKMQMGRPDGVIGAFLREVASTPSGAEIDEVKESISRAGEHVRKLAQHTTLISSIPKDVKKITVMSDQLLKRSLAELRKATAKIKDQLGDLAQRAEELGQSAARGPRTLQLTKEDRAFLKDAFAKIRPPKAMRERLEQMEQEGRDDTFDYVVAYLEAVRWQDKALEIIEERVLRAKGDVGVRFLKNLLHAIVHGGSEQVTTDVWKNLASLTSHVQRLAELTATLEREWARKGEIAESLEAIPLEITACNQAYEVIARQLELTGS
jgi:tetratricopeptide (TPR) repeat protein